MLFNSIDFALFLPIVFVLYWFVVNKDLRSQNTLIVLSSYVFYGWWDWRFLSLVLFSTMVDFLLGLRINKENDEVRRKRLLWVSIIVNLGFLGFFKYFNFFLDNFIEAFSFFGVKVNGSFLNILLPVGISFYTFQTLSYTIDVYKRRLEPTRDLIAFAAFVSFFPQLVAGPIERATHLLPQFYAKRTFDQGKAINGLRQILWGLFKKVVIADNCAEYANLIFDHSLNYSGSTLVLGAILFAFQIYCDFSGYSDIAIGTSRLFGFDLMKNFDFPYFSRDMAEFWRRWHISLSTWFRDYLYVPLGGSRGSMSIRIRNTFIIFIVSGFWHGASWTFIAWGFLNALYFVPLLVRGANRKNLDVVAKGRTLPSIKELLLMMMTFALTVFAWIFFRAKDMEHAFSYISGIFTRSLFTMPELITSTLVMLISLFVLIEWMGREGAFAIESFGKGWTRPTRYVAYFALITAVFWYGGKEQQFIYFQF